jgi:hypothetical protein
LGGHGILSGFAGGAVDRAAIGDRPAGPKRRRARLREWPAGWRRPWCLRKQFSPARTIMTSTPISGSAFLMFMIL